MAFSCFEVRDVQTGDETILSFEQLLAVLDKKQSVKGLSYRQDLAPFKEEVKKVEKEVRREHNIIIEAKLVRLLKREKTGLSVQRIVDQSEYGAEVVELALQRLEGKGMAEEEKGQWVYAA